MYDNTEASYKIREANRKTLERYFAVPHGCDEQTAMHAADCTFEQPYFRPGEVGPLFSTGDPDIEMPEGFELPEFTPEWHWGETKIWGTDDPNFFFARNTGHGMQLTADNTLKPYHNEYFHTFTFRDGKIVHYCEVANPLRLMETMGCKFEPLPRSEETLAALIDLYKKTHS